MTGLESWGGWQLLLHSDIPTWHLVLSPTLALNDDSCATITRGVVS